MVFKSSKKSGEFVRDPEIGIAPVAHATSSAEGEVTALSSRAFLNGKPLSAFRGFISAHFFIVFCPDAQSSAPRMGSSTLAFSS